MTCAGQGGMPVLAVSISTLRGTYSESHCCTALLHSLHGILHLEQASLRAPSGDIGIVLSNQIDPSAAVSMISAWSLPRSGCYRLPGCET